MDQNHQLQLGLKLQELELQQQAFNLLELQHQALNLAHQHLKLQELQCLLALIMVEALLLGEEQAEEQVEEQAEEQGEDLGEDQAEDHQQQAWEATFMLVAITEDVFQPMD
jgi:hypothetical protein